MNTAETVLAIEHAKQKMQRQIRDAIHEAICEFSLVTSLTPKSIDVHMIDATNMSDVRQQYVVGTVSVKISI